jgi:hypothetical protein
MNVQLPLLTSARILKRGGRGVDGHGSYCMMVVVVVMKMK